MNLIRKETKKFVKGDIVEMEESWEGFLFRGSYRDLEIIIETDNREKIDITVSPEEPFENNYLYRLYLDFKEGKKLKIEGEVYQRAYGIFPFYFLRGPTDFIGKIRTDGVLYRVALIEGIRARERYRDKLK